MHCLRPIRRSRLQVAVLALLGAGLLAEGRAAQPAAGAPRELSTDRPDATESPFTLEAGRLQVELDAASYTVDKAQGRRTTEWVVAPFNLRYGLTPSLEAGIFVVPHVRVTERGGGRPSQVAQGLGDVTLRVKQNFQGNDGGPFAVGVMADLKLPTAADGVGNDQVEGAVTVPVAFALAGGWEGGAMTAVAWAHTGAGRRAVWINTVTFSRDLVPNVGGFLELTSAAGDGAHVATFNCGLTRGLGPDLQIDCGINVGISRSAPDLGVFAGLARRF